MLAPPIGVDRAVERQVGRAIARDDAAARVVKNRGFRGGTILGTSRTNIFKDESTAKQATDKNALNTRKLALLAVFGTSSNRFAMVRQANGAVKKVKVGDALDGGRIAAITANAIQYQKGGRMLTLALPTG